MFRMISDFSAPQNQRIRHDNTTIFVAATSPAILLLQKLKNEVLPKWDHPHQYFWPTPGEDATNQKKNMTIFHPF